MKKNRITKYIDLLGKFDNSIYTILACMIVWLLGNIGMMSIFARDRFMGIGIVFFAFALYFWYVYQPRKDEQNALRNLLLFFGFLVRVIYIWSLPNDVSSHDLGHVVDTGEITGGHLGYISYIYHYGKIPDIDPRTVWAYYNPPLYHILSTIWLKINTSIGLSLEQSAENLQILTLLYSSLAVVVFEKILDECSVKNKRKNLFLCFFGTFPMLIWFSGCLTTDSLVLLFALCIMLYTIRWYKKRDLKNIVILAFCIGFGMITKISLGIFAFSVGAIFILVFIETCRRDKAAIRRYIIQFCIFILICAPIGLSWTVRNSVRFDIEADYVQDVGGENSGQYVGNIPLVDRIGIPSIAQMNYPKIQYNTEVDTNIWMTLFRTAIYDEGNALSFDGDIASKIGIAVVFINIFLAVLMLILFIIMLVRKSEVWSLAGKLFFGITYFVFMINFIKFCFDYPQICTMGFRYVSFIIIIPMIGTGLFLENKGNKILMNLLTFLCFLGNGLATLLYLKHCIFF